MAKRHVISQDELHKSIVRSRYLRTCNPAVFEKLKALVQEYKDREKGK